MSGILMESPDKALMHVYTTSERKYNESNGWRVVKEAPPVQPPKEVKDGDVPVEEKQPWIFTKSPKGKK